MMRLPVFLILAGLFLSVGSDAGQSCTPGDINNDGVGWSVADVVVLERYLRTCDALPVDDSCANIDGCNGIDVADAVYFQQFLAGLKPIPVSGIFTPDCEYAPEGDTVFLEVIHRPDIAGGDSTLAIGLYIKNTKPLAGVSAGFDWDNSGLTPDSAVYPAWLDLVFDGTISLFNCDSRVESGAYQRARLYAAYRVSSELTYAPVSEEPQLWATWYFSVYGWDTHDSVVFDTNSFSDGAVFKLVAEDSLGYVPTWGGALTVRDVTNCCGLYTGGYTGNTNCDEDGRYDLSDISRLIDRIYLSKVPLCCEANGNVNGDVEGKINLSDLSRLIDRVYITKKPTALCQ